MENRFFKFLKKLLNKLYVSIDRFFNPEPTKVENQKNMLESWKND